MDWFIVPQTLLDHSDELSFEDENKKSVVPEEVKRKVLLIAIHNHELIKHRNILERTDFKPEFFEIEIFSTLRSAVFENRLPILLVDIGASTTKFYSVERGIILRSYFINQGGQTITKSISNTARIDFKEAEAKKREFGFNIKDKNILSSISLVTDEIFAEANNAIKDFENKYKQTISRVILTGGGSAMRGILEEAQKKLDVDVEKSNPFGRLKHPAVLSETLKENRTRIFCCCWGCFKGN